VRQEYGPKGQYYDGKVDQRKWKFNIEHPRHLRMTSQQFTITWNMEGSELVRKFACEAIR